jgi:hypothetical protein
MSWPFSFGSIDTRKKSCDGHCYDAPALEPSPDHSSQQKAGPGQLLPGDSEPLDTYAYRALKLAQTRILRLHPKGRSPEGDLRDDGLYADLVTVNLHVLEGVLIDGTTQNIHYDALSYSWGHVELSETLVIDGKAKSISGQNAVALRALRHPTQIANLWIDALCINQDDKQEKSEQVAQMLAIYKKARSVTAWLGSPDSDSPLAFECARRLSALEKDLSEHQEREHKPSCVNQLTAIHNALLGLFERPWFGRTWIRQEIYGARQLTVQCGLNSISWKDVMRFATLMSIIRPLVLKASTISQHQSARNQRTQRLLNEAQANAEVPRNGVKQPRNISKVLCDSIDFEYTDPRDTFYAALGMCNVETSVNSLTRSNDDQRKAVQVDYQKTLGEVYTDATFYIISRQNSLDDLKALWNDYRRTPLHSKGLSTWAIDWRSHEKAYNSTCDIWHPLKLVNRSFRPEAKEEWHWPEPLPEDRSALLLKIRILNYVAHLTEYTCHPRDIESATLMPRYRELRKFKQGMDTWRIAILGIADTSRICLVPPSVAEGDLVVAVAPELLPMVIRPKGCSSAAAGLYTEGDWIEAASPIKRSTPGHTARFFTVWHCIKLALDVCTLVLNSCMCISAVTPVGIIFTLMILCSVGFDIYLRMFMKWHHINAALVTCILALTCILAPESTEASFTLLNVGFGGILTVLLAGHLTCTYAYVHSEEFTSHRKSHGPVVSEFWPRSATALCSLLCSILASARVPLLLRVYFAFTLAILFISNLWLWNSEMPTILRREKVRELLDNLVESTGPDYEFHGPLIVRPPDTTNFPFGADHSWEGVWKRPIQDIKLY